MHRVLLLVSTLALGVAVPPWGRDPQGVYYGGNEMALSPRAMLRFGEAHRLGGVVDGERVVPESWVRESWEHRGGSPWSGFAYGYGWWIKEARGHGVYFTGGRWCSSCRASG